MNAPNTLTQAAPTFASGATTMMPNVSPYGLLQNSTAGQGGRDRHLEGENLLFGDGHVKWLQDSKSITAVTGDAGSSVSPTMSLS